MIKSFDGLWVFVAYKEKPVCIVLEILCPYKVTWDKKNVYDNTSFSFFKLFLIIVLIAF